jgi:tetratricopeptide (TPR) repeat protein/tRNA A-37 threonylcarbamoyl transferase component Bud32
MEAPSRLDDLIDHWEELRGRGAPPAIEDLCADCPELAAELRRWIAALEAMDSALDTNNTEPPSTDEKGDPDRNGAGNDRGLPGILRAQAVYRPRTRHDQGGLGVVYDALEEELDRTVALKRIRPDRLREVSRRRFLREAVITARLQHPGIVPVYGLGQDDDGPFYTMPLVRGQTLQQAIDAFHDDETLRRDPGRRTLQFRGLLQQFVAACNTMAYAHDQGVVHRDLKPSNLMLGPYGETLVLDWGLAKHVADAEIEDGAPSPSPSPEGSGDLTTPGEVLGTPQYMSPEQAKGEPAAPAGDIFSLGLVLYAILTGRPAFGAANLRGKDRLETVRQAAVVPPRSLDPRLPRALEAICLKALAARPEDRYSSARALADDVTSWLAGEPVSAWREPFATRARRWARRHRTAVVAAVIAVLTGAAGLGAVIAVQAHANVRLRGALAQSEESRRQAETVQRFLVETFRSPDPSLDGRTIKVVDVLDRAVARLDREFEKPSATKGALLHTLGTTYHGLGLYDRAAGLLAKARAVREAALGPVHPETLKSRTSQAIADLAAGRHAEAIALHKATLDLCEARLGRDHPDTLSSRAALANAYLTAGRLPEAIALHEAVFKTRAAKLGPDHLDTLRSRHQLANAYYTARRYDEAIAIHKALLERYEAKLGPNHPDTLGNRTGLATNYWAVRRYDEAIALHKATLPAMEAVFGPDHPETLISRNNLAAAYGDSGRHAEAIPLHKTILAQREAVLPPGHPHVLQSRLNLATELTAAGRLNEAIPLHEATLRQLEAKFGPGHSMTLQSRYNLIVAYVPARRFAEAAALCRTTLRIRESALGADHPDTRQARHVLAMIDELVGLDLMARGHASEAEPPLREALALRVRDVPDDWTRYGVTAYLGSALLSQARYAEAEPLVLSGYEGLKARAARIPAPERFRLPSSACRVIDLYEAWGHPETAAAWKARLGLADLPADVFARP